MLIPTYSLYMPDMESPEHWRMICILSTVPVAVCMTACYFFMQESPHWLAIQGRRR